jgi:hypothetical protein
MATVAAYEVPGLIIPGLYAAEDLSTVQYVAVRLSEAGQVSAFDNATDKPVGILQNSPDSGEPAAVMAYGITMWKAGDTIDVSSNPLVGAAADGECVAYAPGTATTNYIVGTALSDAAAGDIIPVLLHPATRGA